MWFTRVSISNPVFATMMMAALLVLGAFSYSRLPVEQFPDVTFPVRAVQSTGRSLRELTTLADQVIKKRLENVGGVGQATLVGGVKREIKVYLNLEAMEAQKVGADQVVKALQSENQEIPAGSILSASQEKIVQLRARLTGPQDFRNLLVTRPRANPLPLRPLPEIQDSHPE